MGIRKKKVGSRAVNMARKSVRPRADMVKVQSVAPPPASGFRGTIRNALVEYDAKKGDGK